MRNWHITYVLKNGTRVCEIVTEEQFLVMCKNNINFNEAYPIAK